MTHLASGGSPTTLRSPTAPARLAASARLEGLWAEVRAAQANGDHPAAERLSAAMVRDAPEDAEARLAHALAVGWAAPPGQGRFEDVLVGVALAVEKARRGTRRAMRRRAARALTVLAEVRFDDAAEELALTPGAPVDPLLELGEAALRVLDVAGELDPTCETAPRAVIRLCDALLEALGSRSLFAQALSALGMAAPAPGRGAGPRLHERRLRARLHLDALVARNVADRVAAPVSVGAPRSVAAAARG